MKAPFRGSWTDAKARRASLKLLDNLDSQLNELGYIWGDEDQVAVDAADELKIQVAKTRADLTRWWLERDAQRAGGAA